MKTLHLLLLLGAACATSTLHAQPNASISLSTISTALPAPDNELRITLVNSASGGIDQWYYTVTNQAAPSLPFGSPIAYWTLSTPHATTSANMSMISNPVRIWQVVRSGTLYDTTYIDTIVDCSTLSQPPAFWVSYTMSGGQMNIVAHQTSNCEEVDIFARQGMPVVDIGTAWSNSYCTAYPIMPGPVRICVDYERCSCPTSYTLCDTVWVRCWQAPTATISHTLSGATAQFSSQVVASPSANYIWNFGDGSAPGTGPAPQHTYTSSGTHIACLTVLDSCGSVTVCDTLSSVLSGAVPLQPRLHISPNPAHDRIQISLQPAQDILNVHVHDLNGRVIAAQIPEPGGLLILPEAPAPGIYLIRVTTPLGSSVHKAIFQ